MTEKNMKIARQVSSIKRRNFRRSVCFATRDEYNEGTVIRCEVFFLVSGGNHVEVTLVSPVELDAELARSTTGIVSAKHY